MLKSSIALESGDLVQWTDVNGTHIGVIATAIDPRFGPATLHMAVIAQGSYILVHLLKTTMTEIFRPDLYLAEIALLEILVPSPKETT